MRSTFGSRNLNFFRSGTFTTDAYWTFNSLLINQWAKEHGLLLEAYSPLGSTGRVSDSLSVPEVITGSMHSIYYSELYSYPFSLGQGNCLRSRYNPCSSTHLMARSERSALPTSLLIVPLRLTSMQTVVLPKSVHPARVEENFHGAWQIRSLK